MQITKLQTEFIDFLVASGALLFGDFTTKSGRKTPYFISTGSFDDGAKITALGSYYARHLVEHIKQVDVIFGPAYKGVPLAVATAAALHQNFKRTVGFAFDRKEEKDHGDRGKIVGKQIAPGDKVVIVEDVITAGTTLRQVVPLVRDALKAKIAGVLIAVDRCEKGSAKTSALEELRGSLGIEIYALVNIHQIVSYLAVPNSSGFVIPANLLPQIKAYQEQYGA